MRISLGYLGGVLTVLVPLLLWVLLSACTLEWSRANGAQPNVTNANVTFVNLTPTVVSNKTVEQIKSPFRDAVSVPSYPETEIMTSMFNKCQGKVVDGKWVGRTYVFRKELGCDITWMSPVEASRIFQGKTVLILGDSLSRRLANTIDLFTRGVTSVQIFESGTMMNRGGHKFFHHQLPSAESLPVMSSWNLNRNKTKVPPSLPLFPKGNALDFYWDTGRSTSSKSLTQVLGKSPTPYTDVFMGLGLYFAQDYVSSPGKGTLRSLVGRITECAATRLCSLCADSVPRVYWRTAPHVHRPPLQMEDMFYAISAANGIIKKLLFNSSLVWEPDQRTRLRFEEGDEYVELFSISEMEPFPNFVKPRNLGTVPAVWFSPAWKTIQECCKQRGQENPISLFLLDSNKLLFPRSFGGGRISGDTDQHWGVEARLAVMQGLLNTMRLASSVPQNNSNFDRVVALTAVTRIQGTDF